MTSFLFYINLYTTFTESEGNQGNGCCCRMHKVCFSVFSFKIWPFTLRKWPPQVNSTHFGQIAQKHILVDQHTNNRKMNNNNRKGGGEGRIGHLRSNRNHLKIATLLTMITLSGLFPLRVKLWLGSSSNFPHDCAHAVQVTSCGR